jgi:hypothetical protein
MLARMQDVMSVGSTGSAAFGTLDPADYARVAEALAAEKLIPARPELADFFKGQLR